MAIQAVKFSKEGYEIKKVFGSKSTVVKLNYQIWRIGVHVYWQAVKCAKIGHSKEIF